MSFTPIDDTELKSNHTPVKVFSKPAVLARRAGQRNPPRRRPADVAATGGATPGASTFRSPMPRGVGIACGGAVSGRPALAPRRDGQRILLRRGTARLATGGGGIVVGSCSVLAHSRSSSSRPAAHAPKDSMHPWHWAEGDSWRGACVTSTRSSLWKTSSVAGCAHGDPQISAWSDDTGPRRDRADGDGDLETWMRSVGGVDGPDDGDSGASPAGEEGGDWLATPLAV